MNINEIEGSLSSSGKPIFSNVLTVDVEDWYQGLEVIPMEEWPQFEDRIWVGLSRVLRLLEEAEAKATFFTLGYLAEEFPEVVLEIQKRGHEVGTHGYSHKLIYKQDVVEFAEELRRSIEIIEGITGTRPLGFRSPFFSITQDSLWAMDVLISEGIVYDSSIFPVWNYRYGISSYQRLPHKIGSDNGGGILEIPMSTMRCFGLNLPICGGAYFRILPYEYTKWGIHQLNKQQVPVVFYLHPWELDAEQPRLRLPKRISLTHYANLDTTEIKLKKLLNSFRFTTVRKAFPSVENLYENYYSYTRGAHVFT